MAAPTRPNESRRDSIDLRFSGLSLDDRRLLTPPSTSSSRSITRDSRPSSGLRKESTPTRDTLGLSSRPIGASSSQVPDKFMMKRLPQPPKCKVNWGEVGDLYPHLVSVPPEYVKEKILEVGPV